MTTPELTCFKAYDVRGRIPDELNPDIAYRIGRAYAAVVKPRRAIVGHDIRLRSEPQCAALVGETSWRQSTAVNHASLLGFGSR